MEEVERLGDEVVQLHIKYLQDHLEYLIAIEKDEEAKYDDPTTITYKFIFMKKRFDRS